MEARVLGSYVWRMESISTCEDSLLDSHGQSKFVNILSSREKMKTGMTLSISDAFGKVRK